MQKLYTNNYRRPSLRFLQRDHDRKKEQTTSRQSARLSKAFAMRNLCVPKEKFVTEESAESSPGSAVQIPQSNSGGLHVPPVPQVDVDVFVLPINQGAVRKPVDRMTLKRKAHVDMQKEKLCRWKEQQQRKKDLEMAKKKPFISAIRLVHEMPKFLGSSSFAQKEEFCRKVPSKIPKATFSAPTRTFTLRPRPQQYENSAVPRSTIPRTNAGKENQRTQGKKFGLPLMSSNLEKTVSQDLFSADISRIESVVSFAPENFKFTGLPHLRRDLESARRSSTPVKEVAPRTHSGSGVSSTEVPVDLRRSRRLQTKSKGPAPVSGAGGNSGGTFVIPKTPKPDALLSVHNRVSLLPMVSEGTIGHALDNLIDLSDV